ncbi:hypothetical protein [Trueperella abortisuis]|uniref:Uncharacterized protein n=1 Tax=Trueperella abortisuis TaxID=445930 RepID=A0ABT9PFU0_9ACTO|nr:hypothetical protein [Trueperella abortisuis]MDP9831576.1 hypothetical protein [Trueperella abortisuis]
MERTLWIALIAILLIPRIFHANGVLAQIGVFLTGLAALICAIAFSINIVRHRGKEDQ